MTRLTEEQLTELEQAYEAAVECRTTRPGYVVWHTEADTRVMAILRPSLPSLLAEVRESRKALADAEATIKKLSKPDMFWADGECPNQHPAEFLADEYRSLQNLNPDEWKEDYGDSGVRQWMCAKALPEIYVAYRRDGSKFVTSLHPTAEEAAGAMLAARSFMGGE